MDLVNFVLNKKSELDLTQDIQFLRICLRLDLGKASLPESKAWEIVARAPSILPHSTNLLGPLGRLSLRPLQYHLHLLGLTIRFMSPRCSDPLVLAILPLWQDLTFSHLRKSDPPPYSADLTIFYGRLYPGVRRVHGGFPDIRYRVPGPIQNASSTSAVWSLRRLCYVCPVTLGPSAPGPPGYVRYGQFDSFLGQQTRRDTLSHLVTFNSQASPLARGSERYSPSKTFSRLSERDSRPPISSKAANSDRVVPTTISAGFWGTLEIDMYATVSNSLLPQRLCLKSGRGGQCTFSPNRGFQKEPLRRQRGFS